MSEKQVHARRKWDRGWSGSHTVNVQYLRWELSIESDPDERETKVTFDTGQDGNRSECTSRKVTNKCWK